MFRKMSRALIFILCFISCAALIPAAFADNGESPVEVVFSCIDDNMLSGLHVYDLAGTEYQPSTNADTGDVEYGRFLLFPGNYSYHFHDVTGHYEDFNNSVTVSQALRLIIPVDLTPVVEIHSFSFTYINPAYADILTAEDIPDISAEQAVEAENALRELATVEANSKKRFRAAQYWKENIYYDTIEDAALFLRSQIAGFQDTATLGICSDVELDSNALVEKLTLIWSTAVAHNGNPTEGDYLRYEYGGYKLTSYEYTGKENGLYYYRIPYSLVHYTNAAQEEQLSQVASDILAQLDLNGKSDYQKIQSIYNYLCANVNYDHDHDKTYTLKHTAYAALVNHLAVCQGYSSAFYRLCLAADVDARIITSSEMGHAWNIARLGNQYYELDSTWDADFTPATYRYFLKGSTYWLSNHKVGSVSVIGDQFNDASFAFAYPLPSYNFDDVLAVPLDSSPADLKDSVIDLEDILAALAAQMDNGANDIDRFLVSIVPTEVAGGTDSQSWDVSVSVAAYRDGSVAAETTVDQSRISSGYAYSFSLSVPENWAGRQISYTRSGGGFADDAGVLTASTGNDSAVTFSSVPHLGRFTLEPVKYTLSFQTDGGSAVKAQSIINGDKPVKPADPSKDGYWFTGWYADSAFHALFDFDTVIAADTTAYARWSAPDFVLPSALTEIGEEAFRGDAFTFAVLPENAVSIGPLAFADCRSLSFIYIPASIEEISSTAFEGVTGLMILGASSTPQSIAESFAASHGYSFLPISR